MQSKSLWRWLLISLLAFFVVACKPIASFSVNPAPVKVGVVTTFDASGSMADVLPKNNTIKSYAWDFGDGKTATGKIATHTYAAAGTFKVKLTVIDAAGSKGETTENLVVTAGDAVAQTTTLTVMTQIAGGVSLAGAKVTVGAASGISDAKGLVTLSNAPVGDNQVVVVKKAGYVNQAVRKNLAADTQGQQILVTLLPEKDTLAIAAIQNAQAIRSNYLGASVTLPANALVDAATGAAAAGPATLKLTPWDISGIDLQAMPANGRARNLQGNIVDLISAGMMSVDFFDAAGNKLQLKSGKTADIQMDLPAGTTSIGGNALSVGSLIPMWHFDEAKGLWIEEGEKGQVVATEKGLGVKATVAHFSTWNWDYVARPIISSSGSTGSGTPPPTPALTVSCVESGVLTACNVVATVTYPDGSVRFWSANFPAAVSVVQNMPENSKIQWEATAIDGILKGSATSGATGNVVIKIQPPTTRNFVRCAMPDRTPITCFVTLTTALNSPLANGSSTATLGQYVPETGAEIKTTLDAVAPLSWTAKTALASIGSTWTRYNGSASSGLSEAVTVPLTAEVINAGKTVFVSCQPYALDVFGQPVPLTSCEIKINVYLPDGQYVATITKQGLNGPAPAALPDLPDDTIIEFTALGSSSKFGDNSTVKYLGTTLGNLANNQSIVFETSVFTATQ